MNNFWIVLSHTYLSKLKTKSFLISTLIMLLIIIVLANMTKIIDSFSNDSKETVAVVDQTGEVYEPFKAQVESVDGNLAIKKAENEAEAIKWVAADDIVGYLIIEHDETQMIKGTYKANQVSDELLNNRLLAALSQLKSNMVARELNLTQQQMEELQTPAEFETIALEENAKSAEDLNQARGLVYVVLFVIYIGVIMYANMIAMEVATEKTSRVMEILISSVPPVQQMFAKIFGVALLGLTQMLLFFTVGYFSIKQNISEMNEGFFSFFGFGSMNMSTMVYAIIFTLLGYFLYATLAACLGSVVSRVEDVQQMISPMIMLIMVAFFISMFGLTSPDSTFITITSFIPFFSPMIMFLRVGMLDLPFWQIGLSIGILLGTIVLFGLFGAKVYRGGVLMYSGTKSFKDIKKALQLSKK